MNAIENRATKLISTAWGSRLGKCLAAAVGLFIISLNSIALGSQTIQVQGKDSSWKLVGSVEPMNRFHIEAKGKVDFGGIGQNDDAYAGVTGNAFVKFWRDNWDSIEQFFKWLEQAVVKAASSSDALSVADSGLVVTHWNWVDYINSNGPTVNYDEGAFFIVLTTNDQPPSKGNSSLRVAQPALYYWYWKMYDAGYDTAYDQKIWVWVKVHDGGRDPFGASSFGDNHGSYTVSLDLDGPISTSELKITSTPSNPKIDTSKVLGSFTAATTATSKPHHVSSLLKRKVPNTPAK